MANLISTNQLSRDDIERIFELSLDIENNLYKYRQSLDGKALAITFFEPSTRTRVGFSLAMQKLGGQVVEISEPKYKEGMSSSESLEDTLRVVGDYVNIIALRHTSENFIKQLNLPTSLINCGNGEDEHPTQALIDLYTIWREYGKIDDISVSLVGDLKTMRASHSLTLAFSKFNNVAVKLVSPASLKLPERYKNSLSVYETALFNVGDAEVVYMTGFPPHPDIPTEERLSYQMNGERLRELREDAIILCSLPRIDEITKEVDKSYHARYFEENKWSLYVRMAVLIELLGKIN